MPIMIIPSFLSDNFTQFVRISGFIGIIILGIIWDAKVMSNAANGNKKELSEKCYVRRKSEKNGFHREVVTTITVPELMVHTDRDPDNLHLCIWEHIPAGLYVDLYQTRAAQEFGGPQVYSKVDIDTEKPEHLSSSHTVYVFTDLKKSGSIYYADISLPIHLRYHKPSSDHLYAQIHLNPPQIFLNSSESVSSEQNAEKFVCDSTGTSECSWHKLSCIYEPDEGVLNFSVPVGNQGDTGRVTIITVLITIGSTLFLAHSILKKRTHSKQE